MQWFVTAISSTQRRSGHSLPQHQALSVLKAKETMSLRPSVRSSENLSEIFQTAFLEEKKGGEIIDRRQ
jgi:hypothetical protein